MTYGWMSRPATKKLKSIMLSSTLLSARNVDMLHSECTKKKSRQTRQTMKPGYWLSITVAPTANTVKPEKWSSQSFHKTHKRLRILTIRSRPYSLLFICQYFHLHPTIHRISRQKLGCVIGRTKYYLKFAG